MNKRFLKYSVVSLITIIAFSCSNANNKPIIKFSIDSSSIVIKNIDEVSLLQVKKVVFSDSISSHLISVLLSPGDEDSLQTEQELDGKLTLIGDSLVFKPHTPFLKGKNYLVESYIEAQFGNKEKLLKGTLKYKLEPQQVILKR
ncbi:hypothetical protein [Pedobacter punctiformis]|uniref:Lipoprotein n=1 Tax=Pedobacter punctiformis TaxID=3004097 RepID=A0ABT4L8I9_9SPHI|nr:hypothetical protein [Pedobacter sp. HCMS5-2]MCZ4243483.1 hypothetical protein [Pedobacter sp. HCMS5-2]